MKIIIIFNEYFIQNFTYSKKNLYLVLVYIYIYNGISILINVR